MTELPGLAAGLVEGLVFKGKCYSALLQMLGTRSVLQRLAQLLLTLCELDGQAAAGGILIDRSLTHEELANMVGATRQWVTASIDRFQKQSLLEVCDRKIVILDRIALSDSRNAENGRCSQCNHDGPPAQSESLGFHLFKLHWAELAFAAAFARRIATGANSRNEFGPLSL